ncbi:MAG: PHB depolymerase family esterase [Mariniblastus sp.]
MNENELLRKRIKQLPLLMLASFIGIAAWSLYSKDWHRHRIDVDGVEREYLFYAPPNPSEEKLPLLLAYHGFSGDAERLRRSSLLHEMVDDHRFHLAYVKGNPTWLRPAPGRPCADVDYFDQLCDSLVSEYPIDESRIYVAGMSMGGDFVVRLGGLRSNRIAAVVSQAMITDEAVESERPFPLMVIVGTKDDRVPAKSLLDVPAAFREKGHLVELLRPKGVGHRWHVPLNGAIWKFLSEHRIDH